MNGRVSLAYSPCPNDTYVFAAWTNGLLDGVPAVEVRLGDVEELNREAAAGRHALTKVSYGAIPSLVADYRILRAGGALGTGCGPLVVARPGTPPIEQAGASARFAIPGTMTTAYLLLRMALGHEPCTSVMRFDRIVDAVAGGLADYGVIIHESRFTYAAAGLVAVEDLGAWWEAETGLPIPLGAILVRRNVGDAAARSFDAAIRGSLAFARDHDSQVMPYVRAHAVEMDDAVMRAHIALYVNDFTADVGDAGIAAVDELFRRAAAASLVPAGTRGDFV